MEPSFRLEIGTRTLVELPNFRAVRLPGCDKNLLYRSGYVERLSDQGLRELSEKIRCIVDLRGRRELLATMADSRVVDHFRHRFIDRNGRISEVPQLPDRAGAPQDRVRYTIDFLGNYFFFQAFHRLPLWPKLSIGWSFLTSYITGDRSYEGRAAEIIIKPRGLSGQALDFVDFCQPELATVLRLLADHSNLPCLLHCFLGKDRTGLVVMLVQWLADVPTDVIIREYVQSAELVQSVKSEAVRYFAEKNLPPSFTDCHEKEVQDVMQHINEQYGGIISYLGVIGLTQSEIAALQETFGSAANSENSVEKN